MIRKLPDLHHRLTVVTPATDPNCNLGDWQAAGLLKPCVFKPSFATFEQTSIPHQLGVLVENEKAALRKLINSVPG